MTLTPLEVKLLSLVLDKQAAAGEVQTGAIKLVGSLRKRSVQAQDFELALIPIQAPEQRLRPDFGLTQMPWGRFKGRILADIPPDVVQQAVDWAKSIPEVAARFYRFIDAAEKFLESP
jgi:hypothetical protein